MQRREVVDQRANRKRRRGILRNVRPLLGILILSAVHSAGCGPPPAPVGASRPRAAASLGARIVEAAREEVRRGVRYDASYHLLDYPGGDVPPDRGACTDVVIRALRAVGHDLQQLVHQDARRRRRAYPRIARLDRSIDHRRCGNLTVFFQRHGRALPLTRHPVGEWQPGDIVFMRLPGGLDHVGICSDRRSAAGLPLIIHNAGVAAEEDLLPAVELTARFRYPTADKK
jgi:uncharacterized protein YijF (DUF1287 family)